ncbi:MAG: hydantoinase/oxoprolinase family protein [Solirubrobacteraceae bacterium]|nr:hydantoinase/oxoprolinase family protein [Solirubrobacteraceae bacterium]
MLLGVDVGGTFTDAVLAVDGRLVTAKAPTTPHDQSEGVMAAVAAALERAGRPAADVRAFAHGMTVATNALLEGRGARTALLATEGFTDLVELGRQARPELYRLCAARPAPLTPPQRRIPVPERAGPDGILRPLDEAGIAAVLDRLAAVEPEAVAVVLLHSYAFPEHERALGAAIADRLPGVHVSLSHDVVGTLREYERAATTEVDAALSPLLAAYLRALAGRAAGAGLPRPRIMQSSGGLASLEEAAAHAALTVLSGPAGGAAAAALVARQTGIGDLLCFDMGGTSCDVCVVDGGAVRETAAREVGGRPLALPTVDIHTVGAGGGSIAWRDPGGALRVGPRSAGADPGPACYGRGGTEPTVTDANLLLGRLDPDGELAGGVRLDRDAAERAVAGLAARLGLDPVACAEGIVRVANAEMVRALRVMTVERGVDPRGYALLAFGGAGGLHATAIADELGIGRIVVPRASGVLSALGLAVADRRTDTRRSVMLAGDALTDAAIARAVEAIAGGPPAPGVERRVALDLRYAGQSFELTVPWAGDVREAFHALHEERYGYRDPEAEVELVTIQVSEVEPGPALAPAAAGGARGPARRRAVTIDGRAVEADVWVGELAPGARLAGPAVWQGPEATLLVAPGWSGAVDEAGTVILGRD